MMAKSQWGHKKGLFWGIAVALSAAILSAVFADQASAAKPETWIVIDAASGQVLSEHDADALNYPASLTKIMTLYIAFEALETGAINLDHKFRVSYYAASRAPSKLGLARGQTIMVRDLILAMITKSANDAAVTMAEGLAGNESAFADRMNQMAQALGMTNTHFRNASGLAVPGQYTTARDFARLALALYRDFPREYAFFATESFSFGGKTFETHNHLMEEFEGMDGIKTGFINASGFNLVASAVRDKRRLIGVVLGGRSAESRDSDMAELLDDSFRNRTPAVNIVVVNARPTRHSFGHRLARALTPIASSEAAEPVRTASSHHHHVHGGRFATPGKQHERNSPMVKASAHTGRHATHAHDQKHKPVTAAAHTHRAHSKLLTKAAAVSHHPTCQAGHHHCSAHHHHAVNSAANATDTSNALD
jgi:D-alanyl-D-alanine carboxypeptidase